jgi:hypothetical protein
MTTTIIHVYLLDEGVDCWRPVAAEHIRDDVYRIVGEAPDPQDENWEFVPGQLVRCRWQELVEGVAPKSCLVPYETVAA